MVTLNFVFSNIAAESLWSCRGDSTSCISQLTTSVLQPLPSSLSKPLIEVVMGNIAVQKTKKPMK